MATFVGYEVIAPTGNFNYSTSYLFTNGPFQNAGIKFAYTFSDKVSLTAGLYNDSWNAYTSTSDLSTFGVQLALTPVKDWTAYLNLLSGYASGTEFDLTTAYQITPAFKLGLNAADFTAPKWVYGSTPGGFTGVALYPQLAVSKTTTLGLRAEYFSAKSTKGAYVVAGPAAGESVTAYTLTANIKAGSLTLIPELRLDNASKESFLDSNLKASKSASQFALAAVFAF